MRKSVRRATIALALTPLVSVTTATAALASVSTDPTTTVTTTTPPPDGTSTATAAEVAGILTIGQTSATAGSTGGKADATALSLGGQTISGGSSSGGAASGNLIGTGNQPFGDAEVAPWSANVSHDSTGTKSAAEAALAHVNISQVLEIWLLHSKSAATWSAEKSTGDSSSDGAEVNLGGGALDLLLLHSEAHSGAKGKSDIAVINGNEILSSDQVNGQCEIPADPLLHLICLTASGGTAGTVTSSTADVAKVTDLLAGNGPDLTVSSVGTKGGTQPAATNVKGRRIPNQSRQNNGSGVPSGGTLPFTGTEAGLLAALGAALASVGTAMVAFARRRRRGLAV